MTKRIFSLLLALCLALPLSLIQVTAAEAGVATVEGVTLHVGATLEARFYLSAPTNSLEVGVLVDGMRYEGKRGEDGRWIVPFKGIAATEMCKTYEIVPYYFVTRRVTGEGCRFSVQDYAMRLLEKEETPDATKTALKALLNFGAQCLLNGTEKYDALPNEFLSEEDRVIPEGVYESHFTFEGEGGVAGGYEDTMISVSFVKSLQLRVSADISETLEEAVRLEIADNPAFENSRRYEMKKNSKTGAYEATVEGLYLNALSRPFYIRINRGDVRGKTFTYSVESYCHEIFLPDTSIVTTAAKKTFAHAMMALSRALNAM